jgi:hypothetical protein
MVFSVFTALLTQIIQIVALQKGDILGHEFMGVVDRVGPNVTNLKPGQRVVANISTKTELPAENVNSARRTFLLSVIIQTTLRKQLLLLLNGLSSYT